MGFLRLSQAVSECHGLSESDLDLGWLWLSPHCPWRVFEIDFFGKNGCLCHYKWLLVISTTPKQLAPIERFCDSTLSYLRERRAKKMESFCGHFNISPRYLSPPQQISVDRNILLLLHHNKIFWKVRIDIPVSWQTITNISVYSEFCTWQLHNPTAHSW